MSLLVGMVAVSAALATPSSFLELDGNVLSNTNVDKAGGPYDWANGGSLTTTNNTYSRSGGGGLFDGGHFNGNTTPPTPPTLTSTAASDPSIADAKFIVDPLSVDKTSCPSTGDPTVYTGAGSETNGDLLSSDTFGTGSVPNKDDLGNAYAVAHVDATHNEVFFGGERVVNNGDSHIDFEFLQSSVTIPNACSGSFTGDRTQGDFLLSVDFTTGGTLGDTKLYEWHCVAESGTQPADGTVCNPTKKSPAHYQLSGSTAITIRVNGTSTGGTDVPGGGWVSRNADGSPNTTILGNDLMEGGIDLGQLGFTGCVSTFLPHTRSAQSFTSTLKDFAIIPFETCARPTVTTTIVPTGPIAIGTPAHDTAQLHNATANAGGTISYKLFNNNTCSATNGGLLADLTPDTNTVVNGVPPDSKPYTFTSAGTYYFYAVYTGDARNLGTPNSGCAAEPIVVQPNTPQVGTTIVPTQPTGGASIPATAHDTAQITHATSDAGGTITYKLFNNSTCTATNGGLLADLTPTTATVVNGIAPDSKPYTFSAVGTYYFYAIYSGDSNNTGPVNSGCAAEPYVVKPNAPGVGTTIVPSATNTDGSVNIGASAYDTAQITNATSDAGGTITYKLFNNSTCTATNGGLLADLTPTTATVVNGVAPASKSFTFSAAGTYYFYAIYSGDSNNTGPVNSGCAAEPLVVKPNTPAPHSTPVIEIRDHLSVSGLTSDATGNVVVGLYTDNTCSTRVSGTADELFAAGTTSSGVDTVFRVVADGTYFYKISYAGDNNNSSFSNCGESVTVSRTSLS